MICRVGGFEGCRNYRTFGVAPYRGLGLRVWIMDKVLDSNLWFVMWRARVSRFLGLWF